MAMIAYPVAECTSGIWYQRFQSGREDINYGPIKIRDHQKFLRNCAWIHKKSAEIIIEIDLNGIDLNWNFQKNDLSHFDGTFGLTKGVGTDCSAQMDWQLKMAHNPIFEGHH